jgi:hypothetical protein
LFIHSFTQVFQQTLSVYLRVIFHGWEYSNEQDQASTFGKITILAEIRVEVGGRHKISKQA